LIYAAWRVTAQPVDRGFPMPLVMPANALVIALMLSGVGVVAADQPHQFLRVHVVAVAIADVLLRHRGLGVAIDGHISLLQSSANGFPLRRLSRHQAYF
jgi:hypothetical protein